MLINLRNALMAGKKLPYDAEVEYLENTVVNQANYETIAFPYIDTGIPAADDVGVRITYEYRYLATARGAMVCGSFVASGSGYFGVYNYGAYNYKMWGGATKMPTQIHVGEVLTTSLNFMESGTYEDVLNGATINSGSLSGSPTFNPGSMWAFAINKGNYLTYEIARLRIYGLKITKGSTLVRDYIPVRVGTVGYLYDRVSGQLFGNAGTGDFVLGPDVVPVEYIESHGTEWIDTGVKVADPSTISISVDSDGVTPFGVIHNNVGAGSWLGVNSRTSATEVAVYSKDFNSRGLFEFSAGRHTFKWDGATGFQIDGVSKSSFTATVGTDAIGSISWPLFGRYDFAYDSIGGYGSSMFYGGNIEISGIAARKFLPVRVGTEGALIDTLTRRIYRNKRAGYAFGYGNDLPYPIPAS